VKIHRVVIEFEDASDTLIEEVVADALNWQPTDITVHELYELEGGELIHNVHPEDQCAGEHCTVHNPSDHHMRHMPQHWRSDRGIMERICEHHVGHIDPDEISPDTVHGCCHEHCCGRPPSSNATI
jgi:hypothetical protein